MRQPKVAERPRIYGDSRRARSALTRYITSGEALLDQAIGVRNRMQRAESHSGLGASLERFAAERAWVAELRRWYGNAHRSMQRFLQDQLEELIPTLAHGLPPDTGKSRHHVGLDGGEHWTRNAIAELRSLQTGLGVARHVSQAGLPPSRFEELRASGLVDPVVIDDSVKDMLSPRTPHQLMNAIGAAKELTEATLRSALQQLGMSFATRDDLNTLMKKWREAIGAAAAPDARGLDGLKRMQASLVGLITFLVEWRNEYGRGHGRSRYPSDLAQRHARLAADAAEATIRFVVTTMDDLELLPP